MVTFDSEYKDLLSWYNEEKKKIKFVASEGLDGGSTVEERKLHEEYRKKLKALKIKYDK